MVEHTDLLPGIGDQAFIDIDSLLRPVFGHAKQGASYGHTKIAGIRLRAGRAGSGKGAASMVREAISTARAAGARGEILVRGDSAYGNSVVAGACLAAGARFSLVLVKNSSVTRGQRHHSRPRVDPGAVSGGRCSTRTPVR